MQCFHLGSHMVVINPSVCIDCGACVKACPVDAIVHQDNLVEENKVWLAKNRMRAEFLPVLTTRYEPLIDQVEC